MKGRISPWLLCIVMVQWMLDTLPAWGAPQALRATQARLTSDSQQGGNSGRLLIEGIVDDTGTGIDLRAALLAGQVSFRVNDSRDFVADVPLGACTPAVNGVRCSSDHVRARIRRVRLEPHYRVRLSVRRLSAVATGTLQPLSPVTVTVQVQGQADLIDVISDCDPVGRAGLSCRDQNRPNIIFIVTDDQRADVLQYMPRTLTQVAEHGVNFRNAFVTTPLCSPSRASMLNGQYARHHNVRSNVTPNGGAPAFVGPDASTIATWLHDAGYRTGMYGKYMTQYSGLCPPARSACYIPPGWDEWHVFLTQKYYNYILHENGVDVSYGATPSDYSTDVIAAKAVEFINGAHGQPFFLHVGFHAPHQESDGGAPIPAERHVDSYPGLPPWRPPSYDEEDISDKPAWAAAWPRASSPIGFLTYGLWSDILGQEGIRTLAAVDEGIEAMFGALEASGQADNTIVIFTSDNGYFRGEHRRFFGKDLAYEESIRIPAVITYPRLITNPRTVDALVTNLDFAPTIARLAGVASPPGVDGLDLTPVLEDRADSVRADFLFEWWNFSATPQVPTYVGVRTEQWKYVSYPSVAETELYDLVNDPYELDNRAHDPSYADVAASLDARLAALLSQ